MGFKFHFHFLFVYFAWHWKIDLNFVFRFRLSLKNGFQFRFSFFVLASLLKNGVDFRFCAACYWKTSSSPIRGPRVLNDWCINSIFTVTQKRHTKFKSVQAMQKRKTKIKSVFKSEEKTKNKNQIRFSRVNEKRLTRIGQMPLPYASDANNANDIHSKIGWRQYDHRTHKHTHGSWILCSVSRVRPKTMRSLSCITS